MKKYLVCPDPEPIYPDELSAGQLIQLYGVDPQECMVWKEGDITGLASELIPLLPDFTGEYRVPDQRNYDGEQ